MSGIERIAAERQQQIEARPPKHGDVWINKKTGEGRSVLMVCGHDDEDATVSGFSLRPGRPPFALPLATFLARHILIAVDPDLEHERLAARLSGLEDTLATKDEALQRVAEQQPKTLAWIRAHGIVFDDSPGTDPSNWQHVAFSIYSDLCETDSIARAALNADGEATA